MGGRSLFSSVLFNLYKMQNIFEKYGNEVREHPVEVRVADTNGRYFLPDDSILRNDTIIGLNVVTPQSDATLAADLTLHSPLTDRPLINRDAFFNSYISLFNNNIQLIYMHPLSWFGIYQGDKGLQQLFTTSFTPQQSYITVAAPTTVGRLTAGESFLLNFYYLASGAGQR